MVDRRLVQRSLGIAAAFAALAVLPGANTAWASNEAGVRIATPPASGYGEQFRRLVAVTRPSHEADAAPASSAIAVAGAPALASVTLLQAPGTGSVTVSRAADALGQPIDFSRLIRPANESVRMPSRLPVAALALTSGFGARRHPLLGTFRAHSGVDLAAPTGSPVVATSDGMVSMADWSGGYGLLVTLNHGSGMQTRYGHLSRLNVAPGQKVRAGDVIGFVGSTGLSTGPHLHYELRFNGQAVNPVMRRKAK